MAMPIPRFLVVALVVVGTVLMVGPGLWISFDSVSQRAWTELAQDLQSSVAGPDSRLQTPWERSNAVASRLDRHLERLTLDAPPSRWLRPRWQGLLLSSAIGNETVYVGDDLFLELRRAVDAVVEPSFLTGDARDPRPALRQLARDLEARQISLWILPIPSKISIHPQALGSAMAPIHNVAFAAFCAELETFGIEVIDPSQLLLERARQGRSTYLSTDSHWHPEAMAALAADLAPRLESRLGSTPRRRDWRRTPREIQGKGDLLRLLEREGDARWPPEKVEIQVVTDGNGQLFSPERSSDILVLGDSFTNVFSDDSLGWGAAAGFVEQLAFALGRPVDRLAVNGGGALGSRQRLAEELQTGRPRLDGKKVVILQFAARELGHGAWPVLPLATAVNTSDRIPLLRREP